ncbi:TetR/AcrR family transcriptional regulator [Amycolatopsis saalfeldensis]|uniref:DNA-binding transcriptional regulator, AcrR family n=1 Tax=Amycolatopsis saalfeldensis TaxID=394193 RepID=A0A1H8U4W4_9PSEU|nr:TetR/AcrR family transcriptional regulator [Amycolatopsis saalfeldensis]SEO97884.1 DNA-binding transcriptional regulator, AcrR family [Amycolatopsis saalfeldensis]
MTAPGRRRPSASAGSGLSRRRRTAQVEGSAAYLAKRSELLQIAGDVFKEKGFEAATLNDIAARFGTDRAAIYYYFAGKDELFQEVFQATAKTVLEDNLAEATRIAGLGLTAREKLRKLIDLQVTSYKANYPYVHIYIQEDMGKVAFQSTPWAKEMVRKTRRFESIVTDVITGGIRDGEFRDDLVVPLVVKSLFGMVNWTHRWLKPGDRRYTAEQTIDTFSAIFFDGLRRPS